VNNFSDSILDGGGGGGVSCLESELKQAVKKKILVVGQRSTFYS
jgi:hypothetical protein